MLKTVTCDFIDIINPVFIRYHKNGQSLLVLLPSEESEMIKALEAKKIPINKIRYWHNGTKIIIFRYAFWLFFKFLYFFFYFIIISGFP